MTYELIAPNTDYTKPDILKIKNISSSVVQPYSTPNLSSNKDNDIQITSDTVNTKPDIIKMMSHGH